MPLHRESRFGVGEPQAARTLKRRERRAPIPTGFPRVARASQPWADGRSPVGANQTVRSRATPSPQRRIVAELDAEATQMEAVRALLPRFEAKIQRVLDRVWGNGTEATP